MKSGIYRIVHLDSGRCYVGQSVDLGQRLKRHVRLLNREVHPSRHLQRAWRKYGPGAFFMEVLEECPEASLTEREQAWFSEFGALYNAAPVAGSQRGYKHTPEARANMTAARRDRGPVSAETRAKMSAAHKGLRHTDEAKAKISAAQSREPRSDAVKLASSLANKGRVHTAQARANMRAGQLARYR